MKRQLDRIDWQLFSTFTVINKFYKKQEVFGLSQNAFCFLFEVKPV